MMRITGYLSVCFRRILVFGLFWILCDNPVRAAEGPFPLTPIYNPSSKSYFQLFGDNHHPGNWEAARTRAAMKSFKNVRGRLAVIDSVETHKFVLQTFDLTRRKVAVWIGLRYWCKTHLLQWDSSRPFSPSDAGYFRIWHARWSRNDETKGDACQFTGSRRSGFAPIYYRTIGASTRWQAVGAAKFFPHYLVEFPTGKE